MAEAGDPDCVDAMRELGLPFDETKPSKHGCYPVSSNGGSRLAKRRMKPMP
jgi:hypothetical protein